MRRSLTPLQEKITETLLQDLQEKKLREIEVRSLCRESGVGRASFYRNYERVEDILTVYAEKLLQDWALLQEPDSSPESRFLALFMHIKQYRALYRPLFENRLGYPLLEMLKENGALFPLAGSEKDKKIFVLYGLYGWITEWVLQGMKGSPQEMSLTVARYWSSFAEDALR
ncbi:MAG: TetR/AcrR family transcriptional regulator [Erysipelotrichaceae bacterium]|nr:TetR/AcrR family transcriptional regulator [Erysipelotrichaceae bacterium]